MKIKIKGEMSLAAIRQCIYEQLHTMEDRFDVRHADDVTIYLNLTNGTGRKVVCKDGTGKDIIQLCSQGPYIPAAIRFDLF